MKTIAIIIKLPDPKCLLRSLRATFSIHFLVASLSRQFTFRQQKQLLKQLLNALKGFVSAMQNLLMLPLQLLYEMLRITRSLWRAGLCILLEEPAFNRYRGFKAFFHLPIFTNTNIPPFHICPFFPLANAPLQHILFAIFFTLGLIPLLLLILPLLLLGSAKQWLEVMWQAAMFMLRSLLLFLHFLLTSLWFLIPSLSVSKFREKRREQVKKHFAHVLERRILNPALTLSSHNTDLSDSGCYRTMDLQDTLASEQSNGASYKDFTFHWKKKHAKTTACKEPELILNFLIVSPLRTQNTRRHTKFHKTFLSQTSRIIQKATKPSGSGTLNFKLQTSIILHPCKSIKSVSSASHLITKANELMPTQERTTGALSNSVPKQKPLYTGASPSVDGCRFHPELYCFTKCQMPSFSDEREVLNNFLDPGTESVKCREIL